MPIEPIQKFLGHSKLETTQRYAESSTAMMRESYQRALSRWAQPWWAPCGRLSSVL